MIKSVWPHKKKKRWPLIQHQPPLAPEQTYYPPPRAQYPPPSASNPPPSAPYAPQKVSRFHSRRSHYRRKPIMALGFMGTCAKYSLFCFNVLFFLGGCVALGTGIWMALDTQAAHTLVRVADAITDDQGRSNLQSELTPGVIQQAGYILIGAGAATIIVAFLGCCGAIKESQCLLVFYVICLLVVLGLEVAAGIYSAVAKQSFENNAKALMMKTLKEQYMNNSGNAVTFGWNRMMAELECCGVSSSKDFFETYYWKQQNPSRLPVQCCKLKDKKRFVPEDPNCQQFPSETNSNMNKGCYDALIYVLKTHLTVLIIIGLGVGLFQLLGIILTCILTCSLDTKGY